MEPVIEIELVPVDAHDDGPTEGSIRDLRPHAVGVEHDGIVPGGEGRADGRRCGSLRYRQA